MSRAVTLIGRRALTFAWRPGDTISLLEVGNNVETLAAAGLYEVALVSALRETWRDAHLVSPARVRTLLRCANRARLVALGNDLPGPGPFTVYRGRSSSEPDGIFWSSSICIARLFALRTPTPQGRPQVYRATVAARDVYVYVRWPDAEFVVPDLPSPPTLMEDGADAIGRGVTREGLDAHFAWAVEIARRDPRTAQAADLARARALAQRLGMAIR